MYNYYLDKYLAVITYVKNAVGHLLNFDSTQCQVVTRTLKSMTFST